MRLNYHGQTVHHHLGVSAFAEYAVVSRNSLIKIDRDLPFVEAALFGCAVRRGYPQAGSLSPEAIACGPLAQAAVQNITQFDEGSARRLRLYAYADRPKYPDK